MAGLMLTCYNAYSPVCSKASFRYKRRRRSLVLQVPACSLIMTELWQLNQSGPCLTSRLKVHFVETSSCLDGQVTFHSSWNLAAHYPLQKTSPPIWASWISLHLITHLFQAHFNINLLRMPRFHKRIIPVWFPYYTLVYIFRLFHAC
jgi:hypothetical protein